MTSFANLNIIELKEYNKEDNMNISIDKESQDILKQLSKTNSYNILLDLNGKELSSEDMSEYIEDLKNKGTSSINFIIGGSNGVNKELKNSVDMKLKFSHFTFPHQLMRLILLEQVYRWFAISNNIKYHKQGDEIIKGNFILTTKDSYNEECVEELIGEIEGELKEDLENIKFSLENAEYEYFISLIEKEIFLIRNSGTNLNIHLKFNGEKNNFFYEVGNFKQNFLVLGEKYSYNVKNKTFQFSYILFDENNNEINKIEIAIRHV